MPVFNTSSSVKASYAQPPSTSATYKNSNEKSTARNLIRKCISQPSDQIKEHTTERGGVRTSPNVQSSQLLQHYQLPTQSFLQPPSARDKLDSLSFKHQLQSIGNGGGLSVAASFTNNSLSQKKNSQVTMKKRTPQMTHTSQNFAIDAYLPMTALPPMMTTSN